MSLKPLLGALSKILLVIAVSLALTHDSTAQSKYKVLYAFTGHADGGGVWDSVVFDTKGNLYGTTSGGGDFGYGTVFELTPTSHGPWAEAVLHSFMLNDLDGSEPDTDVILDSAGNLYGTTANGGAYNGGTAFELTPGSSGWTLTVLYNFGAYSGDVNARSGLLMDKAGNLYGAGAGGAIGGGAVFELTPSSGTWLESLPYSFCQRSGCADGSIVYAGVTFDRAGNLYGTTDAGGNPSCLGGNGCGVVYELRSVSGGTWKEAVLHTFNGAPNDGAGSSRLAFDSSGNLYGTGGGGNHICFGSSPCGTVYKMTRGTSGRWQETVIYDFTGGATGNGPGPSQGLVIDQAGNLYGTTFYGGSTSCGCGVVYKLAPGSGGTWTYSVLHTFLGSDGAQPTASMVLHNGKLYGTTVLGGSGGAGVVFELAP
jgi:uncharacterized repeat protein (TIGR03803 family)